MTKYLKYAILQVIIFKTVPFYLYKYLLLNIYTLYVSTELVKHIYIKINVNIKLVLIIFENLKYFKFIISHNF